MKRFVMKMTIAAVLAAVSVPALADEGHLDIYPYLDNGVLKSGSAAVDEDNPGLTEYTENIDVFGADLTETAGFYLGDAPGFFNENGTLDPGMTIGINLLAPLREWTGTEFDLVNPSADFMAVGVETIDEGGGDTSQVFFTPASNGTTVDALRFTTDGTDGGIHAHSAFTLQGNDSETMPIVPTTAPGIYLMEIELFGSGGTLPTAITSDPIWVVFNAGLTETEHDAAIDWTNQNLSNTFIPEPASAALVALGGVALMSRRRRRA